MAVQEAAGLGEGVLDAYLEQRAVSHALTMGAISRSPCRASPSRPLMSRLVFTSTAACSRRGWDGGGRLDGDDDHQAGAEASEGQGDAVVRGRGHGRGSKESTGLTGW